MTAAMEHWRQIPDWVGVYEVSSSGRVRSLDRVVLRSDGTERRKQGQLRQLRTNRDGYLCINLFRPGHEQRYLVHRLVLAAFRGPPPVDRPVCRHLNGIRDDNRLDNLAWGTWTENNHDQIAHGTHAEARRTHCANGHEFTVASTRVRGGTRHCRPCELSNQIRYQRRKAALLRNEEVAS